MKLSNVNNAAACRARSRKHGLALGAAMCLAALVSPAEAADAPAKPAPAEQVAVRAGPVLEINEAVALARSDQPSVAAFEREAIASEEAAIAARSLPDPQITAGIQDFPVTGKRAFSPTADDFTMYTIGVMREQVRRSRREAEAAQLRAEAVVSRFEGSAQDRRIQRDIMIAWINAVEAAARQRLLARVIGDLKVGRQVIEAGIPTGSSTPALELEAQAEIGLAEAQLAEARGTEARARGELARWIGRAAQRPLPDSIPNLAIPPTVTGDLDIDEHPEIRAAEAKEQAARRQIDVARSRRRPNLTWSVTYGWRPSFGDLVSAQVSIPLQLNRGGLQNRRIAEAEARADAARLRTEDARRELGAEYETALAQYRGADAQLTILRDRAIPSLEASFKAAEARYAGGQGTLELPLNIVRRYVEANIQLIEQEGARARAASELIHLVGEHGQ